MGGVGVGGGGGWEAEGGLYPPLGHRQQYCTFSNRHKQPQCQDRSRRSLAAVWHYLQSY